MAEVEIGLAMDVPALLGLLGEYADQMPYATARALTTAAKRTQYNGRAELEDAFTLRNNFIKRGVSIKPAKKVNLEAQTGHKYRPMETQATGGVIREPMAIPTGGPRAHKGGVRGKDRRKTTPPSRWPSRINQKAKKKPFRIRLDGKERLVQETAKKAKIAVRTLYLFTNRARVKKAWDLEAIGRETMRRQWPAIATESLEEALRTAKKKSPPASTAKLMRQAAKRARRGF